MNGLAHRASRVVLAMFLAAADFAIAGVNRWTTHGPYGGRVMSLASDPGASGTVYAGISGAGIFKTVDGAVTWSDSNANLPDGVDARYVEAIDIDPSSPAAVYAAFFSGGIFKSSDAGASWQHLAFDAAVGVAVDPRRSSVLNVATANGYSKSLDGGATWQAGTGLPEVVRSLVLDRTHADVLYALAVGSGYSGTPTFRTLDGGMTWQRIATPFESSGVFGISVDPATSRLYAATNDGVFVSDDRGEQWRLALEGHFTSVSVVRASEAFAVSFDPVVFQTRDGGDHWTSRSTPVSMFYGTFAADPRSGIVYGGSYANGVIRSLDDGATWTPGSFGQGGVWTFVVSDPEAPTVAYAGSDGGLFRTANGGQSWSLVDGDFVFELALEPGSEALYSRRGRSSDGGVTWTPLPYPDGAMQPPTIVSVPVPSLLVGTCTNSGGGIFGSVDQGATWSRSFDAGPYSCVSSVVASASGPDAYATTAGVGVEGELLRSRDGGVHWQPVHFFLPQSGWTLLAVDPANADVVYGTSADALLLSTDGGGTWRNISPDTTGFHTVPPATALVVDPNDSSTLYAAMMSDVFRSVDRGSTWAPLGAGLPTTPVRALTIDATGRFLHAGTLGGVFEYQVSPHCDPPGAALCLEGGHFLLTVEALDPRSGRRDGGQALAQSDQWGYFSFPAFTGDPGLPEVVVKIADATAAGGGYWVFHSGLTDLEYTLSVVDTVTGVQKTYQNDRSNPSSLCGGADTGTFASDAAKAAPASSLPLLGRFSATLKAVDPRTGVESSGVAIPPDPKWGYFSLPDFTGDASFPEVFVKMLDATALPGGAFWVFHTGLTDLQYTLTVTDSTTGEQKTYRNDRSDPNRLCGGADTQAFH